LFAESVVGASASTPTTRRGYVGVDANAPTQLNLRLVENVLRLFKRLAVLVSSSRIKPDKAA